MSKTPIFKKFWCELMAAACLGQASGALKRKDYVAAVKAFESILVYDPDSHTGQMACKELGNIYEKGLGVEKNMFKAEEYYLRAGDRGDTHKLHEFAIRQYTEKYKE